MEKSLLTEYLEAEDKSEFFCQKSMIYCGDRHNYAFMYGLAAGLIRDVTNMVSTQSLLMAAYVYDTVRESKIDLSVFAYDKSGKNVQEPTSMVLKKENGK